MSTTTTSCTGCGHGFASPTDEFCRECGTARGAIPDVVAASPDELVAAEDLSHQPAPASALQAPPRQPSYAPAPSQQTVWSTPARAVPMAPVMPVAAVAMPVVAPKSPGLSLLASFFLCGLGSALNGEVGKGFGIWFGYVTSILLASLTIWFFGLGLIFVPFIIGFYVWGLVDAYAGAQKWNARHGIVS